MKKIKIESRERLQKLIDKGYELEEEKEGIDALLSKNTNHNASAYNGYLYNPMNDDRVKVEISWEIISLFKKEGLLESLINPLKAPKTSKFI